MAVGLGGADVDDRVGIGDYPTKSSEGQTEGEGGDKDSLPFYYLFPSCVVSSGFGEKIPEKRWAVLKRGEV